MIRRVLHYIFFEDALAKLACLLVGVGLWFYVEFARVSQITINVPIDYVHKPQNMYLKSGFSRFIKVVVRGREEFLKFPTGGIKAEVNLSKARLDTMDYPVLFDEKQLPERIEIFSIPKTVSCTLERAASRRLSVHPVFSGNLDGNYKLARTVVDPDRVEVTGPESVLAEFQQLDTESIDLTGKQQSFNFKADLRIPESLSVDSGKSVRVKIQIVHKSTSEEVDFDQVPLRMQNLDSALNVAPSDSTTKVVLQGDAEAIKKIKHSDIYVYVNLEDTRYNAKTGNILPYTVETGVPVRVKILSGSRKVTVVSVTPEKVNIRFSVKPEIQNLKSEPGGG